MAQNTSKVMIWVGRVISAIPVLMMGVLGLVIFFTKPEMMNESMTKYGYPVAAAKPIFLFELFCVVLYVIPQTSVLGAILLTGYLGGAVATHVHGPVPDLVKGPLQPTSEPIWFPIIFATLIWVGLLLRDARLRELLPLTKRKLADTTPS